MVSSAAKEVFIQGITSQGRTFRPSDWADRLCGMMSVFGEDRQLSYSPYLKPRVINGVRCLVVDTQLKDVNPEGYAQLSQFADENQLRYCEVLPLLRLPLRQVTGDLC